MPSLLGFDDQLVCLCSVNTLWIRHGNVGIRSFCLNSTLSYSSKLVKFLPQETTTSAVCSSLSNLTQPCLPVSVVCVQQPISPTCTKVRAHLIQSLARSQSLLKDCSPVAFLQKANQTSSCWGHERTLSPFLLHDAGSSSSHSATSSFVAASPLIAETLALRNAMISALQCGINALLILSGSSKGNLEIAVLNNIYLLSTLFTTAVFKFILKLSNVRADSVLKQTLSLMWQI